MHRLVDARGDTASLPRERRRVGRHHLGHDGLGRHPGERRLAQQHLVEHAAEREDIAARVYRPLAHRLLGAHVVRRAERHAGLGHAGAAGARRGQRDPEVRHQRRALVQQDVLGLDVAVDHAVAVGVVERGGDFGGDADRVVDRKLLLARQPVAQDLALDERHDVVQRVPSASPRIDQRRGCAGVAGSRWS